MDDMAKSWTTKDIVFEYIPVEDIKAAYSNIEQDLKRVTQKSYAETCTKMYFKI